MKTTKTTTATKTTKATSALLQKIDEVTGTCEIHRERIRTLVAQMAPNVAQMASNLADGVEPERLPTTWIEHNVRDILEEKRLLYVAIDLLRDLQAIATRDGAK